MSGSDFLVGSTNISASIFGVKQLAVQGEDIFLWLRVDELAFASGTMMFLQIGEPVWLLGREHRINL